MNTRTLWAMIGLVAAFCASARMSGQIVDGRAQFDTAHYVSLVVDYSVSTIRHVVADSTVTSIVNGSELMGTNLSLPEPVTLGVPALGTLKVNWEYKAIQMEDGSGTAIIIEVSAVPAVFGQGIPVSGRYIVMRPNEVAQKFKDRNAAISAVLYSMYFVYYNGGNNYGFTGGYAYSMLPYTMWYGFIPPGTVLLGPTVFIGIVP
jgi:hypothetical protein